MGLKSLGAVLNEKKLSLLVSLPENNFDLAKAAIDEGADAIKMHVNVDNRASGNCFYSTEQYQEEFQKIRDEYSGPIEVVPGGSLEDIKESELEALWKLGFNYYSIYAHHLPSSMVSLGNFEKTFAIQADYLSQPRGYNLKKFGITALEASVIPGDEYGTPLTFRDILTYQGLVERFDVPIIVPSQRKLVPTDIPHLKKLMSKVLCSVRW